MTLELERPGRRVRQAIEAEELKVRNDELKGWLRDLEIWVEAQLEATDVLVKKTVNGRSNPKAKRARKADSRVA
jgi:hypothetical protein